MTVSSARVPGTKLRSMIAPMRAIDVVLVAGIDVAQVDLALGPRRDGVDALAAADQADIQRDAAVEVGQRVDRLDLAGQFLDGADAAGSCRPSAPPCR